MATINAPSLIPRPSTTPSPLSQTAKPDPTSPSAAGAPHHHALPQAGQQAQPVQQPPSFQDLLSKSQGAPANPTQSSLIPQLIQFAPPTDQSLLINPSTPSKSSQTSSKSSQPGSTSNSAAHAVEVDDLAATELKIDVDRSLITQQASQSLIADAPSLMEQQRIADQQNQMRQSVDQSTGAERVAENTSHTRPTQAAKSDANTSASQSRADSQTTTEQASLQSTQAPHAATNSTASPAGDTTDSSASLLRAKAGTTLPLHANASSTLPSPNSAASSTSVLMSAESKPAMQSPAVHASHKSTSAFSKLLDLPARKPEILRSLAHQESLATSLSKISQSLANALRSGGQLSFRITPDSLGAISVSLTPVSDGAVPSDPGTARPSEASHFNLTLTAADPAAAQSVRDHIESLRTSLQEKGITIASIQIKTELDENGPTSNAHAFNPDSASNRGTPFQNSGEQSRWHQSQQQPQHQSTSNAKGIPLQATADSHDLAVSSGTSLATLMPLIRAGLARLDAVV